MSEKITLWQYTELDVQFVYYQQLNVQYIRYKKFFGGYAIYLPYFMTLKIRTIWLLVTNLTTVAGLFFCCEVTKICQGYQLNLEKERAVILFPTLLHSLSRINSFARVSYIKFLHQAVQYCMTNQRLRGAKSSANSHANSRVSVLWGYTTQSDKCYY
jgi:hypothetical protein